MVKNCTIQDCEGGGRLRRGWCSAHYSKWRKYGDPLAGSTRGVTPDEAFAARTEWRGDCLVWTAGKTTNGYGVLYENGRQVRAHRFAWERVNGPIPEGMVIDHRCWNKACANVDHLRLATVSQNAAYQPGPHRDTTTGARGVYRRGKRYLAQVRTNGVTHHLGAYASAEEASAVATAKRAELFGEFAGRA